MEQGGAGSDREARTRSSEGWTALSAVHTMNSSDDEVDEPGKMKTRMTCLLLKQDLVRMMENYLSVS